MSGRADVKTRLAILLAVIGAAWLIRRARAREKPLVMFITGAPFDALQNIEPYFDERKFRIMWWNYAFGDMEYWGEYFTFKSPDDLIRDSFAYLMTRGFRNLLYVDVTECSDIISGNWQDSVLEPLPFGLSLMSLDPSKTWYHYLKEGMLGLTLRFPDTLHGFAIDRLDRLPSPQEEAWAEQLLDEVKTESGKPLKYVMNALQPWQTSLASRALFIGEDNVYLDFVEDKMAEYAVLAKRTETGRYYLAGRVDYPRFPMEIIISDYRRLLAVHDFTYVNFYMKPVLDALFPIAADRG